MYENELIVEGAREIRVDGVLLIICGGENYSFETIAYALCMTEEELEKEIINAAIGFKEMGYTAHELTGLLNVKECMSISEEGRNQLYKLDFSRPIIQHQVTDRRPRLIRKVIH